MTDNRTENVVDDFGAERDSVNEAEKDFDDDSETEELLENDREREPELEEVRRTECVNFESVTELDGDMVIELDVVRDHDCVMVPLLLEVLSEGDFDALLWVVVAVSESDTDALMDVLLLAVLEMVCDSEATAEALSVENTQHPLALEMHSDLLRPLSVTLRTD